MAQPDILLYPPDVSAALGDDFVPVTMGDPGDIVTHDEGFTSAKYLFKPLQDELLAQIASRVASKSYNQIYTSGSSGVNTLVYISGALTVDFADANNKAKSACCGRIRSKPTATTALLDHFWIATGVPAGVPGDPIFLANGGDYSATPGTFRRVLGTYIDTTVASCHASPRTAQFFDRLIRARLTNSGAQAITNDTTTTLTFDTDTENNDGIITAHAMTIQTAGLYRCWAQAPWALNATGPRAMQILVNGVAIVEQAVQGLVDATFASLQYQFIEGTVRAAAGDTVVVKARQKSGGSLNITGAKLTIERIGD